MLSPAQIETAGFGSRCLTEAVASVQVEPLTEADREAALDFLFERPIHTVIMAGWVLERGIKSPEHRGTFYGCWNAMGILEGVALIGRATMFETRSDAARLAFAELARQHPSVQLIFAETDGAEKFWRAYARKGQKPQMLCHELLYEKEAEPVEAAESISGIRKAATEELLKVASAHAEVILEETGKDPLANDRTGFLARCARRVEQGKVWMLMKEGEIVFKADVVAETPQAVYIEGLWVNPRHRRKGYGKLCWKALTDALLTEGLSICGFVNHENATARAFYEKVGCRPLAHFSKIFI